MRVRTELGLSESDAVDPRDVAVQMGVSVVSADELVPRKDLEELERLQAYAFSAATFKVQERHIIVVNPIRTVARQNSDVAHELAHLILKHELSEVRDLAGTPFRTCRPDEELQATTFGGTLLLPRPLLVSAAKRRASIEDIADQYDVTVEMARFRYNTTGVGHQVAATRRKTVAKP